MVHIHGNKKYVSTGWANKKQANFKLPPFQKFFISFVQTLSVSSILTLGDRVEK